jgi:protein involved in polysaccharide export with SLBB domain
MRNLWLAGILLAAIIPGMTALAAPPGGVDYRLDVGDKLKIKVFEWRSATGDVHEWTPLTGEYDVGADGAISMPLLGGLKAAGMTIDQLADAISNQLQTRLGLTIRPQASIDIVQYRPFYILGDVNKPGEYPYRPGLTVLEAISIAGGRYRVNDPALVLNASGDLRVLRLQYNQLLAQRARLEAEQNDANAMTIPPELQRRQNDPQIAQLIQREQAMFTAHRDAETSEMNAVNELKSLLSGEVASLQQKMSNLDQELSLRKQELNNTTSLVQRGLAIAPREYEQRETELETEGRRFDLDTAALRAKEDIGKADQSMVELRNKDHSQIQSELAEVEQKIPETAARIATNSAIVDRENGAATANNADTAGEDPPAICLIMRTSDGKAKQINGDEITQVEPGDTIKVLRAGSGQTAPDGIAALSGSASPSGNALLPGNPLLSGRASLAADPPEHAEIPRSPSPPASPARAETKRTRQAQ